MTATAEELVRRLEGVPPAALGKVDGVMAGLVRAELNLSELLGEQEAFRERAIHLHARITALIVSLRRAYPGRWDPVQPAEGTAPPAPPTTLPQDESEER